MDKRKITYTYSKIGKIAYPIFLTLLIQNLIQVTDTAFLGHVGEVELGASALAGIYYVVVFMLAFGFSTGSQILIGRRNGEGNYSKIGEIILNGFLFLFVVALFLFSFTRIFSERILSSLLTSKNVLDASLEYLDWRIYGIFFSSINVMFRAFFVGTTKTKVLSANALVMALVNTLFNYLLIFGNFGFPKMGIAGSALGSVIAEVSSVLFFIIYTYFRVDIKKYGFKGFHFKNLEVIKNILNVSFSLMIQYVLSLGTWFYFFLAIEHLGETSLAISNVVRSMYMIITIPIFALGATTNTLVSNTIGAGRKEEVIPLIWKIAKSALFISGLIVVIIAAFPKLALSIYTSDKTLIDAAFPSLMVVLSVIPIIAVSNIFFNSVSGTGNTRTALWIEGITLLVYVSYMYLIVVHLKSSLAVCWTSEHVYMSILFILSFIYLRKGNWQNKEI